MFSALQADCSNQSATVPQDNYGWANSQGCYAVAWGRFEPATLRLHGTEHTAIPPHSISGWYHSIQQTNFLLVECPTLLTMVTILSGSLPMSSTLLKTFFYSWGSHTGSNTDWMATALCDDIQIKKYNTINYHILYIKSLVWSKFKFKSSCKTRYTIYHFLYHLINLELVYIKWSCSYWSNHVRWLHLW